ncbi:hypothetical protein [Salinimicrobium xinjiangense]|uniref:hypothetical protein n=1 Tax=Salinimicrobium xinjiangense TaxID=438596 RepID=UPI00040BA2E8|nr:hypothetical protein [Salinimicrobium xinjiangense]
MKKFLLILLCTPAIMLGQSRDLGPGSSIFANNLGDFALQKIDKVYNSEYSNNVSGEIYLFDDWQQCIVKTNLKEEGLNFAVPCNYNLLTDQFEMKVDNEIYFLQHDVVVEIQQGNRIFIPNRDFDGKNKKAYMEVLGEGDKFDLVKIYELKIKDVQSKRSLGLYEKKISTKDHLFFVDQQNDILIEVPGSKRKIYNILDLNEEEKKQIKGNIKRTENLIEAVRLAS